MRMKFSLLAATFLLFSVSAYATVDDSLSFAYEAAGPYVKQGYTMREDAWGGDLGVGDRKAVTAQLFWGNEYWFLLASNTKEAQLTVHIYDSEGKLADSESWQKGTIAAARVNCKKTGTYYAIVQIVRSPEDRTNWALVYGYR